MLVSQLGNCCGAAVVYSLPPKYYYSTKEYKKCVETQLNTITQQKYGMFVCVVNQDQIIHTRSVFKKCGWKLVATSLNPNMHNSTWLYLFVKIKAAIPLKTQYIV